MDSDGAARCCLRLITLWSLAVMGRLRVSIVNISTSLKCWVVRLLIYCKGMDARGRGYGPSGITAFLWRSFFTEFHQAIGILHNYFSASTAVFVKIRLAPGSLIELLYIQKRRSKGFMMAKTEN